MKPTVFWVVVVAAGVLACSALAAPVVLSSAKVGGLLVACAPDRAAAIVEIIRGRGYSAARRIGRVEAGESIVRIE